MKKYLIVTTLAATMLMPLLAGATSVADLQAQIAILMAKVQELQAQLKAMQGGTQSWCHTFNTNLKYGDYNEETTALILALKREEISVNSQDLSFNSSVSSAVTAFQEKYKDEILTPNNLQHGTGYVGKATRAKLNMLYGCEKSAVANQIPSPTNTSTGLNQSDTELRFISPSKGDVWVAGQPNIIKFNIGFPYEYVPPMLGIPGNLVPDNRCGPYLLGLIRQPNDLFPFGFIKVIQLGDKNVEWDTFSLDKVPCLNSGLKMYSATAGAYRLSITVKDRNGKYAYLYSDEFTIVSPNSEKQAINIIYPNGGEVIKSPFSGATLPFPSTEDLAPETNFIVHIKDIYKDHQICLSLIREEDKDSNMQGLVLNTELMTPDSRDLTINGEFDEKIKLYNSDLKNLPTGNYRLRAHVCNDKRISDLSDAPFTISNYIAKGVNSLEISTTGWETKVVPGSKNVELRKYTLHAGNGENIKLTKFGINIGDLGDPETGGATSHGYTYENIVSNLRIISDGRVIGSIDKLLPGLNAKTNIPIELVIPSGESKSFSLLADISPTLSVLPAFSPTYPMLRDFGVSGTMTGGSIFTYFKK